MAPLGDREIGPHRVLSLLGKIPALAHCKGCPGGMGVQRAGEVCELLRVTYLDTTNRVVQGELSRALLNENVLLRFHKRYGAVKGLCHWMRTTLDIAQNYQLIDNGQVEWAIGTLDKMDAKGGSDSRND